MDFWTGCFLCDYFQCRLIDKKLIELKDPLSCRGFDEVLFGVRREDKI